MLKIKVMFNKETEYALRGLVFIQQQNKKGIIPGLEQIASEIDAPRFYIAKILQRMVKQGFLRSQKGKGGGFYFEAMNADLTLKEVILSTEGDKTFNGCGFGLKNCSCSSPCPLHHKYAPIRDNLNRLVSTETIQSLAVIEPISV